MEKNQKAKGSLTVEAALVVPIFLFATLIFLYFFQISYLHEKINSAMTQVALYCSKQAYLTNELIEEFEINSIGEENEILSFLSDQLDIPEAISGSYYKFLLQEYIQLSTIENSIIVGGYSGIDIYQSGYLLDGETIDIIVSYECKLPLVFFGVKSISCIQRIQTRGWIGVSGTPLYEEVENTPEEIPPEETPPQEEEKDMVYIAETGKVYHLYSDCSHLKLSITKVQFQEVEHLRNSSGGKYKSCQNCVNDTNIGALTFIYITTTGDRYHTTDQCSGLKRTVTQIEKKDLPPGYNVCKRCKAKEIKMSTSTE